MIVHIVLFEPRPDLTLEQRSRVLDDLRRAAATITAIRRFRIGRRIRHGRPGYEQMMQDAYTFAAVIEFDDQAGLEAYLEHPAHTTIAGHFGASALRALAYDYEMADATDPAAGALATSV